MLLRRICAWCGAALDSLSASLAADTPVTHGICPSCLARFQSERTWSLEDFLERLEGPVVLVDADGVFLAANSRARTAFGRERQQLAGRRGGEVIDCLYAQLPGGCGASIKHRLRHPPLGHSHPDIGAGRGAGGGAADGPLRGRREHKALRDFHGARRGAGSAAHRRNLLTS